MVPSGSAARTLALQSLAIASQSACTPEQLPALANDLANFARTLALHSVASAGAAFCATLAWQVRSPASLLPIAFRRRAVHLSARAVAAERTSAATRTVPAAMARDGTFNMRGFPLCDGPDERAFEPGGLRASRLRGQPDRRMGGENAIRRYAAPRRCPRTWSTLTVDPSSPDHVGTSGLQVLPRARARSSLGGRPHRRRRR